MPNSDMEPSDLVQSKLNTFSCDVWWREFIEKFYTITALESQSQAPHLNPDGTTARSLYWTLLDVSDFLKTDDLKKREKVLGLIIGDELGVPNFLFLLQEIAAVFPINLKVSGILRECMSQKNGNWRTLAVRSLLDGEYLTGFLTALTEICIAKKKCSTKKQAKETLSQTNINIFWAFSTVVHKDSKFGSKLCSLGQTKFLHRFIRETLFSLSNRPEAHYPYLKILRFMSKSANVSKRLSRDGVFTTLRKVLDKYSGPPTTTRQQLVLDILVILTKSSRLNCKKFLKAGLLISVMRTFGHWTMLKVRALSKMTKAVLNIYGYLAGTMYGRRALLNTDSLAAVRKFAENCPSDKLLDETIFKACSVISQAHGRHKLPFKSLACPLKFRVPTLPDAPPAFENGYGSSSEESDDEKHDGGGDDIDDKDSDVEPEDALGATDYMEDDSDDSNIDIEQLLIMEQVSDTSLSSANNQEQEEVQQPMPRFKVEKNLKQGIPTHQVHAEASEVPSSGGIISQQSIDAFEEVTKAVPTPLFKLIDFGHFFKELDDKQNPDFNYAKPPEHISKHESIVLGLLNGTLTIYANGQIPIPTVENKYSWKMEHKEYGDLEDMRKRYFLVSKKVRSIIPFVKAAYPDMAFAYHRKIVENVVQSADRYTIRSKAITIMGRAAGSIMFKPKVIYDLDALIAFGGSATAGEGQPATRRRGSLKLEKATSSDVAIPKTPRLGNTDEQDVGKLDPKIDHLQFESRFESGNLRKVVQIGDKEYDLYLMSDVNSGSNTQWFYFQVSNIVENVPYTFNIVNCVKSNSQFNYGMQPVLFSVAEALDGKPGWVRSGVNVCYHKNGFHRNSSRKTFYTVSFSLVFHRRGDICYIAYHYPYPYTRLLVELWKLLKQAKEKGHVYARYDVLCESLNKNEVPLLTVTAPNDSESPIESRDIIVLTARVHPGEPNASWMMHGVLHRLLLGPNMEDILKRFIFKIIPMLNVEGVINGCSRNGLSGDDLNRMWKNPNAILHPSIFNAKGMIEHCIRLRNKTPILYCDFHGHSRKKNAFVYGCSLAKSWSSVDRNRELTSMEHLSLPEAMSRKNPTFSTQYCNYEIKRGRESTARVALWRDFGISRSYTLEASYCGCDRGLYKGQSMGICQLIECGEALCHACGDFLSEDYACSPDAPKPEAPAPTPSPKHSEVNLVTPELDSRYKSKSTTGTKATPKQRKTKTALRLKSKRNAGAGLKKRATPLQKIVAQVA